MRFVVDLQRPQIPKELGPEHASSLIYWSTAEGR
jgi:hypothetical protein